MKIYSLIGFFLGAALIMTACSDDASEAEKISEFAKTPHVVSGKVEKGPMVYGSTVEMRTLDSDLSATGSSYTSSIGNNVGDFDFGSLKISSPYAKLTADGYFFNEVTGKLSVSTIKLDAIVDLSDNSTVNVNILTHLKSKRITQLVTNEKKTYAQANKQAQEELLKQFGLQRYISNDAATLSIAQGDQSAGCLIAVSTIVIAERSEAEIVEFLSKLTNEFASNGEFSESSKEALHQSLVHLNSKLDDIDSNIRNRYSELGYDIEVPDLQLYYDWDDDGIAGNEIDTSGKSPVDVNCIDVPVEGGTFTVNITNDITYYLESPLEYNTPTDTYNPESFFKDDLYEGGYTSPYMDYSRELTGKTITIKVAPNKFRTAVDGAVYLYDARSNIAATIQIKQAGNQSVSVSVPKLGGTGQLFVATTLAALGQGWDGVLNIQSSANPEGSNGKYNNSNTADNDIYTSLRYMTTFSNADQQQLNVYGPYIDTYKAMAYLLRASYWGGVVIYDFSDISNIPPATQETEVYNTIIPTLKSALPNLEEKRITSFTDVNSTFFASKDVARILLAQAYCGLNNWHEALSQLNEVINNGYYSLSNSNDVVLGLQYADKNTFENTVAPMLTYREVLLLKAECLSMTGNESSALTLVKQVAEANGISIGNNSALMEIGKLRVKLNLNGTLPYLRRHNLGQAIVGRDVSWINLLR